MAKIAKNGHAHPKAWIVSSKDRGRKSIKKGNVFLEDKEEFEIEIFNPLKESVLADIKLNGSSISESGLVIRPGQRFYLDCFIDDKRKFVFNTYEVDGSDEISKKAIEKNGLLEVFFYKEEVVKIDNWRRYNNIVVERWYPYYYPYYQCSGSFGGTTTYDTIGTTFTSNFGGTNFGGTNLTTSTTNVDLSNSLNSSFYSSNLSDISSTSLSNTSNLETGRVEKGNSSNQKFESVNMNFENYYISSTILTILPESRKPIDVKRTKTKKLNSDDIIETIKKLSELNESGILTDEEFNDKKLELLSKI